MLTSSINTPLIRHTVRYNYYKKRHMAGTGSVDLKNNRLFLYDFIQGIKHGLMKKLYFYSGFKISMARGGIVRFREKGLPCHSTLSDNMPPLSPMSDPPKFLESEFIISL